MINSAIYRLPSHRSYRSLMSKSELFRHSFHTHTVSLRVLMSSNLYCSCDDGFRNRKPVPDAVFHSDSGGRYTSEGLCVCKRTLAVLRKYNLTQSMSEVGCCFDKEEVCKLKSNRMTIEQIKRQLWRFVQYYNK